jgi:hypothetical protein
MISKIHSFLITNTWGLIVNLFVNSRQILLSVLCVLRQGSDKAIAFLKNFRDYNLYIISCAKDLLNFDVISLLSPNGYLKVFVLTKEFNFV